MKTWKSWSLMLVASAAAWGVYLGESPGVLGREMQKEEMSLIIGGAAPNKGVDKCQNACSSAQDQTCDTTIGCWVNTGGSPSEGDRCAGGGGGNGYAYNCVGVAPWDYKCSAGGAPTTCTPQKICIWQKKPKPANGPGSNCASGFIMACTVQNNPGQQSGVSYCTNVPFQQN